MRSSTQSRLKATALTSTSAQRQSEEQPEQRGVDLVLIVDDNSDTRDLYSFYLRTRGYTVRTAHDGRQGVELALRLKPDVIVMDLSMPALDGINATKQLRRDARTRNLPIVIFTGYPARAIHDGALEAGADAFVTKPCLPEDLEHQVRRVIGASRSR